MRRRFFVEQFRDHKAVLEGETAHHLGHVLRAKPGQLYELSDGQHAFLGRIETVQRDRIEFALLEEIRVPQPGFETTLLLAIVKFDAFEWALEKATELGVNAIVPIAASRSEKALIASAARRSERWRKILAEASQQSRRLRVPQLEPVAQLEEAFSRHKGSSNILFSERPAAPHLRAVLDTTHAQPAKITIGIGPEGGWTEEEFSAALVAGFQEASLGPWILRTETAVTAALACLNFAMWK